MLEPAGKFCLLEPKSARRVAAFQQGCLGLQWRTTRCGSTGDEMFGIEAWTSFGSGGRT
jgi:hypothetical protein